MTQRDKDDLDCLRKLYPFRGIMQQIVDQSERGEIPDFSDGGNNITALCAITYCLATLDEEFGAHPIDAN